MDEIIIAWMAFLVIVSVITAAKFLRDWRRDEPESYRRWGSPNLFYNFGMYLTAVYGSALDGTKSVSLLRARRNLRIALLILLAFLLFAFFGAGTF